MNELYYVERTHDFPGYRTSGSCSANQRLPHADAETERMRLSRQAKRDREARVAHAVVLVTGILLLLGMS